jgi:arylsulfatase
MRENSRKIEGTHAGRTFTRQTLPPSGQRSLPTIASTPGRERALRRAHRALPSAPMKALLRRVVLGIACVVFSSTVVAAPRLPNVIVILCDDLGYADIGAFGCTAYATPHLDRMAKEGRKFTNFHVSQAVCSASRTALLTGCYNNRLGIHGALGPGSRIGIHANEMTLAELFKQKGYATGMAGKWHLGHHAQFLPTHHGFDEYLGLPYSNDMWPHHPEAKAGTYPKLPLIEGDQVKDPDITPEKQPFLTTWYTERAVKFIERNKERSLFF